MSRSGSRGVFGSSAMGAKLVEWGGGGKGVRAPGMSNGAALGTAGPRGVASDGALRQRRARVQHVRVARGQPGRRPGRRWHQQRAARAVERALVDRRHRVGRRDGDESDPGGLPVALREAWGSAAQPTGR